MLMRKNQSLWSKRRVRSLLRPKLVYDANTNADPMLLENINEQPTKNEIREKEGRDGGGVRITRRRIEDRKMRLMSHTS